jgi:hypothetical protein
MGRWGVREQQVWLFPHPSTPCPLPHALYPLPYAIYLYPVPSTPKHYLLPRRLSRS